MITQIKLQFMTILDNFNMTLLQHHLSHYLLCGITPPDQVMTLFYDIIRVVIIMCLTVVHTSITFCYHDMIQYHKLTVFEMLIKC